MSRVPLTSFTRVNDGPDPRRARSRLASLLLVGCAVFLGCEPQDPGIAVGGFDDADGAVATDEPDAAPGTPDAAPGTPDAAPVPDARPSIPEVLDVAFDTTANSGQYAPKNIVAVWIERADGTFVKTIGRWAKTRRSHLVAWVQGSGDDVDAVTGATRSSHNARLTAHWDFKDRSGNLVPDGAYVIRMELADSNSFLAAQNRQGTFALQKNGTASMQSTSGSGFMNVVIDYSGR
jgi:hypothetical protein